MPTIYVGLSGFSYREWQGEGLFYPPKLQQADYLHYYARRYSALESVGSFTRVPSASTVAKWISVTPDGFRIAPKMHQKVTHFSRLKPDGDETRGLVVESLKPLNESGKLGPILLQLPPNLKRNDELLQEFLVRLPERGSMPWAIEFRNTSWHAPEVEDLLRAYNIAWAIVETDDEPAEIRTTASFEYVRLRKIAYTDAELVAWADRFQGLLAAGKDVYVFCRHAEVEAPWLYGDFLQSRVQP